MNKKKAYRLGVIDFMQTYGKRKRMETTVRKILHPMRDSHSMSVVDPLTYGIRFLNFMREHLFEDKI